RTERYSNAKTQSLMIYFLQFIGSFMQKGRRKILNEKSERIAQKMYLQNIESIQSLICKLGLSKASFYRYVDKWQVEDMIVSIPLPQNSPKGHYERYAYTASSIGAYEFALSRMLALSLKKRRVLTKSHVFNDTSKKIKYHLNMSSIL